MKTPNPELRKYMDKRLFLQLNGGRKVSGVLRGYDPFMNIVLEESVEETNPNSKNDIGMIVSHIVLYFSLVGCTRK
jgi:small nuclear ribonucleoprotein G